MVPLDCGYFNGKLGICRQEADHFSVQFKSFNVTNIIKSSHMDYVHVI